MSETPRDPDTERYSRPRWVKVSVLVAVAVIVLIVILLVAGGHGPARHI